MTKMLNVRLDNALLARLDALAAERGTDRSALVREAVASWLDPPAPAPAPEARKTDPAPAPDRKTRQRRVPQTPAAIAAVVAGVQAQCPHPRGKRQVLGYMTKCLDCGARLR